MRTIFLSVLRMPALVVSPVISLSDTDLDLHSEEQLGPVEGPEPQSQRPPADTNYYKHKYPGSDILLD